jgi:hypothetical protein
MKEKRQERLPRVVEDRLREAYGQIRRGEIRQMKKRKITTVRRSFTGVAAACAIVMTVSVGAVAAAAYFQKEARQEADALTYIFDINYELVPGEYKVTPGYLPAGFEDQGDGKYYGDDGLGITVMPIYTTAELDRTGGELSVEEPDKVEHMTLSGMEADMITFREAEKYQLPTYIFMFNETEGYVLQIISQYPVERGELVKFADSLTVTRTGDTAYEPEDKKAAREQAEEEERQAALAGAKTWDALAEAGIPADKILGVGDELLYPENGFGYTVTGYEFLDSIRGFDENKFFDFSRFKGWVNEDGTLKPYTRQHLDENMQLMSEEQTEQEILRVNIKVHCYDGSAFAGEAPLDFTLQYVKPGTGASLTWDRDEYISVPNEHYELQMDNSAVYLDKATHTQGEDRKDYFFCKMKDGEELSYTLLFVVDKDRKDDFLLYPTGGNNSIHQTETETVKEIRDELDGYIRLK